MSVPGGIRLRPMGVGDLLDETFRLYRRHFLTFVTVMAVVAVPQALFSATVGLVTGVGGAQGWFQSTTDLVAAAMIAIPIGLVLLIVYALGSIATIALAADAALGRPTSVAAAYRVALSRFAASTWAGLVVTVALSLLALTCIGFPVAVYLGAGWSLFGQVVVIERRSGFASLRRSAELVSGHRWRVLGIGLVMFLLVYILVSLPAALVGIGVSIVVAAAENETGVQIAGQLVNAFFEAVGQSLFGGLVEIAWTILYYELRVRKEAFDLELLAAGGEGGSALSPVDPTPPPANVPPRPNIPPPPLGPR